MHSFALPHLRLFAFTAGAGADASSHGRLSPLRDKRGKPPALETLDPARKAVGCTPHSPCTRPQTGPAILGITKGSPIPAAYKTPP